MYRRIGYRRRCSRSGTSGLGTFPQTFTGDLYETNGPSFNVPFNSVPVTNRKVGTATFAGNQRFRGNAAIFDRRRQRRQAHRATNAPIHQLHRRISRWVRLHVLQLRESRGKQSFDYRRRPVDDHSFRRVVPARLARSVDLHVQRHLFAEGQAWLRRRGKLYLYRRHQWHVCHVDDGMDRCGHDGTRGGPKSILSVHRVFWRRHGRASGALTRHRRVN